MTDSRANEHHQHPLTSLWRRAPWWRATTVAAVCLTGAAALLWADSQLGRAPAPQTVVKQASQAQRSQNPQIALTAPSPSRTAVTDSPLVESASEDEQVQAMCHPHLLHAPASMPQVDVAQIGAPNLGHIKIHLWVNGAGFVTRDLVTAASLGAPAEQQAELAYAKELTFVLPDTRECRAREVEVIGDFFEHRDPSGQWATYVRLYPRFTFGNTGALQRAD